jgi:hypothetical protein
VATAELVAGYQPLPFFCLPVFTGKNIMDDMIAVPDFPAIDTKAAARIIGCRDANVRILLIAGRIRGRKIGRDWWVDADSAKAYAESPQKTGRPRHVKNS